VRVSQLAVFELELPQAIGFELLGAGSAGFVSGVGRKHSFEAGNVGDLLLEYHDSSDSVITIILKWKGN
jgi:hypothetical protein